MIIEGNTVFTDGSRFCQVRLAGDRIESITTDRSEFQEPDVRLEPSWLLSPGLIDAQINGAFGKEFKTDPDAISHVASQIVRFGVTGFVPTVTTKESSTYSAHLEALEADAMTATGARVLGIHVEGPALNPKKRGAHPEGWLVDPSEFQVGEVVSSRVRIVTLAPELPGGWDLGRVSQP